MFEALRRMILPIIIIVLVVFMGMIVLQWGLDITSRQQYQDATYAGVINGEEISWQTFSRRDHDRPSTSLMIWASYRGSQTVLPCSTRESYWRLDLSLRYFEPRHTPIP